MAAKHWFRILPPLVVWLMAPRAAATPATGHLDAPNSGKPLLVGGWARDPDHSGPISVHIYIDGKLAHAMLASGPRPDLPFADQNHGFSWIPPLLGPGSHSVVVYAIGVNSAGTPDGQNPSLPGSPATIAQGCTGFVLAAKSWCQGVPAYYTARASDTHYLYNDQLKVGINTSFGGTIFELYARDHSVNRLTEHGGGAVQLSVWGYEPKGPSAYFADGAGVCDPTPYASSAACTAAGHASCRLWCCSQGAHVADCSTVKSCVNWGAGAPFNPIQAQAKGCGWDSPTNDVTSTTSGSGWVRVTKKAPYHFTKNNSMPGMVFEQTATLRQAYVQLDYRVTYSGPYSLSTHPQEIPAVFPAAGMHHTYFYYSGSSPWATPPKAPKQVTKPSKGLMLRLANRGPYPHASVVDDTLSENWVTACNAAQDRCLTIAFFSKAYREVNAAAYPGNGYGYLTPLGGFAITPGMDRSFTLYLFPYRHDETVAGKTVRRWIRQMAAASGCLAHGFPCDDNDPGTTDDRCQGDGSCVGTKIPPPSDAGPLDTTPAPKDQGAVQDAPRGDSGARDSGLDQLGAPPSDGASAGDAPPATDSVGHGDSSLEGSSCSCQLHGAPAATAGALWPLLGLLLTCLAGRRRRGG